MTGAGAGHIVHTMNNDPHLLVGQAELETFQKLMASLMQCCQEQSLYRCERFGLNESEQRTLLQFGDERYLTAKGLARKLNVAKSRVTKIVSGLVGKGLLQRSQDPDDSRYTLLSLTHEGRRRQEELQAFLNALHAEALAKLSPSDRDMLLTSMGRLRLSMESVKELLE